MAEEMWQCQMANCGYIYNPAKGDRKKKITPGTKFTRIRLKPMPLRHQNITEISTE